MGRLSHAINRMAGRLKGFVTGQKRFLGDAAHELCSPLARMEIALEILEERSGAETLSLVRDVREEVTHMRKLANELFSFSKASLGDTQVKLQPVSVAEVVAAALYQEKGDAGLIELTVPDDLVVRGHFELLQRAVANLVRNARRYAGDAGPISISARQEAQFVFITVDDLGPGVPSDEVGKLFDPFYRADPSRTSETGGVGLGQDVRGGVRRRGHGGEQKSARAGGSHSAGVGVGTLRTCHPERSRRISSATFSSKV